MDRRVDLHRRAEQRLGTDLDARAVENDAAGVDVDAVAQMGVHAVGAAERRFDEDVRSEEHTSELQSLMRISYAVFGLQKKHSKTTLYIELSNTHKTNLTMAET